LQGRRTWRQTGQARLPLTETGEVGLQPTRGTAQAPCQRGFAAPENRDLRANLYFSAKVSKKFSSRGYPLYDVSIDYSRTTTNKSYFELKTASFLPLQLCLPL
jgi:hypothetical protein